MFFRVVQVLLLVAASADSLHDETTYSQDEAASDEVAMLQAQVQEQQGSSERLAEAHDEHTDGYNLEDFTSCASEKGRSFTSSDEPASVLEKTLMSYALGPMATMTTSDEPPGAGALRFVFQLLITMLFCDGMRRLYLQKQATSKCTTSFVKSSIPQEETREVEAAAEAAWVEMVNAAAKGNLTSFELALNRQATLQKADTWGCTPLHFAAIGGSVSIGKELLDHGADIDARDASDETPLHFAARAGYGPFCELLLNAGANADAVNMEDMTPLIVAGHANAEAACRLLTEHGAGVADLTDAQLPPLVVSLLVQQVFAAAA